jgi:lipopolysaccharide transport system ATP-binding protein
VAFSGVEKFIDTPVKRYSSGMYVRLAFAVAAHLDPEILIVDEVLAVGDAEFQKKCLGKMGDVSGEGRTVLFVSHNMGAIRKLCPKTILLINGKMEMATETQTAIDRYLYVSSNPNKSDILLPELSKVKSDFGRGTRLLIKDEFGNLRNEFKIGEKWKIRLEFIINEDLKNVIAAIGLNTQDTAIITYWTLPADLQKGEYYAEFYCDLPLKANRINLIVGLSEGGRAFYYLEEAGSVEIATISLGEQPLYPSGAGLFLGKQNIHIKHM